MSISGVFPVGALTGYANPYCCVLLRLGPQSGPNRMWVAVIGQASMSPTQEEFLAELERLGVGAVRERIATNVYLGGLRDIAQGWADRKSEASNAEQLSLTRRTSADAHKANVIAIVALTIASVSMIMAIAGVLISVIALRSHP